MFKTIGIHFLSYPCPVCGENEGHFRGKFRDNRSLMLKVGMNARTTVLSQFSLRNAAMQYLELYQQLTCV